MSERFVRHIKMLFWVCLALLSCVACDERVPAQFVEAKDSLRIYPDYKNVVVPKNVAPLNFQILNEGDSYAVSFTSDVGDEMQFVASEGKVIIERGRWKEMVRNASELAVNVFVKKEDWEKYSEFKIKVVSDSIDKFVTFRLIEPSYENSADLALYQHDVEEGVMKKIVGNRKLVTDPNYSGAVCMNCHVAQSGNAENTVFQYRCNGGGMIVTYNGKSKVISTKVGDMPSGAVYEKWHPTLPLIVFSNNTVRQTFPSNGLGKIEVLDFRSDILMYDVEKNTIRYVLKSEKESETYPVWSPCGDYLYYCSTDTLYNQGGFQHYKKQKYDLKRLSFKDGVFGEPEMVYKASEKDQSIAKPRLSPDGRFVAMTVSKYGAYHYMHKSAEVALFDLKEQSYRLLDEVNSSSADGYVTWSSNGRWLMVGSRRDDGDHVRLYFSYFDKDGVAHKPFSLPHEDPLFDAYLLKSYNCPEFSTRAVPYTEGDIYDLIAAGPVLVPDTIGDFSKNSEADGVSGASVVK